MSDESDNDPCVAFDYVKAYDFRTMLAEGVIGGVTPQRKIHCAFYTERPSIPQRQVFKLEGESPESYVLGDEDLDKQVSRKSVVREMCCDLVMTPDVAESIGLWLVEVAKEAKKAGNER